MTLPELRQLLGTLGHPVTYMQWDPGKVPELPYVLYYTDEDVCFYADDCTYFDTCAVTIEVYSTQKDLELEQKIKKLLTDNQLSYTSYESFLDTEHMFLRAYEIYI